MYVGSAISEASASTRAGNVESSPLLGRRPSARNHPRTVFTSFVRAPTRASRVPHIVFRSRDARLGTCTDGRSIRHDTSLRDPGIAPSGL